MTDRNGHHPPLRPPPADSVPTAPPRPVLPAVASRHGPAPAPSPALTLGLNIGEVGTALPWLRAAGTRAVRIGGYWRNMLDPRQHEQLGRRTVERHFLDEVRAAARAELDLLVA
ncbi:MAG TPA: hypothetical protein VEA99_07635, partial [Gemmatimonadaceae bacterium]|nr:hypothetical protein [Gemmatimonadaceae bacterium]